MCVAAIRHDPRSIKSWADAPSIPDESCTDTWTLVNKTVLAGERARPVVKLEFTHPSAEAVKAALWKPSSFGRYMVVKVPMAAARAVQNSVNGKGGSGGGSGGGGILALFGGGKARKREVDDDVPAGSITGDVPPQVSASPAAACPTLIRATLPVPSGIPPPRCCTPWRSGTRGRPPA